ncbi:MAG: DNA polymerase III subunit delta' [Sphingomicrobium sp.]
MIIGQDKAVGQFASAWAKRALHHAWLLSGPRGVGKAHFARMAATRVLADGAGPDTDMPGLDCGEDHPIARLVSAGSHPDLRMLERLENPKTGNLARSITVDQVRSLGGLIGSTPFLSPWRAVVIDCADDLEPGGANALLKMLEEPPANTIFLLVAHAPGRLLPTIRSRCRRLDFQLLDDAAMTSILEAQAPAQSSSERQEIVALAGGSVGRAMAFAALDLGKLQFAAVQIIRRGDPTNGDRSALATELGKKGAADRYAAFLALLPALVAKEVRSLSGAQRSRALDAYGKVRELTAAAPRLSLDPAATIFQLGGILATVANPLS